MEELEPRGDAEKDLLKQLAKRGWTVTEARRDGADLDLMVEFEGTRGRVRFRHGAAMAKSQLGPQTRTSPCYVRVDLGDPSGAAEQWALWDHYELFRSTQNGIHWICLPFHEALGASWASVASNAVTNGNIYILDGWPLRLALERAEALSPGRERGARRESIFEVQRKNAGPVQRRGATIFAIVVWGALSLGFYALALNAWSNLVAALILGGLATIFLLPTLIFLHSLLRVPKAPLEGMEAVVGMIRKTGAFDTFELIPVPKRAGLPVVVREGHGLGQGFAPLWLSRMAGTSNSHPLRLEADLCEVKWPSGTIEECRFLPERWLTIDLIGPEAELARLPPGPREARRANRVRWLFTGEELDSGAVEDLLHRTAPTQDASPGSPS